MSEPNNPQVREILDRAAELPADQRAVFLDEACAGDAELRREVESLLAALDRAEGLLEAPTMNKVPIPGSATDPADLPPTNPPFETPGSHIGPYKLLQQIGEGGMGIVFMAEQEKPVRRRVALKIIKPGMDSRQVIARFEAERQALAMMEHAHIARVYDAGTTDSGRPYFVMELVQGVPITHYCDEKHLTPHERLELFIPVCQAIQHAHQKGIIHRDLKPSNVLVMIYEGKPVPKIIDFGVAKALHHRLTEKTLFTQYGHAVGTPEYMSPEQAEMDVAGTDTRTDIYSLGVVLYELLTGSTPLDRKKLRQAGYAEMLKTIREEEPPKPSTRVGSSDEVASISALRHIEPRKLMKLLSGDLDWIIMKCLEKERSRRYETANGLARDVQRYLDDEAVEASPPSTWYRMSKTVRRHRGAFVSVAAVLLALLAGLAVAAYELVQARRGWAQAQANANTDTFAAAVRSGQFRRAADELATFIRLDPKFHQTWYHEACLLAYLSDVEAYRTTCHGIMSRFGSTLDRAIADRTAKACLLIEDPDMLESATELADRALSQESAHMYLPWFQMTKGLAEYRAGHYEAAIEWIDKGRSKLASRAAATAFADPIVAMAQWRLGRIAEARASLDRATDAIDHKLGRIEQSQFGNGLENVLICHVLGREAESVIGHGHPQSQPSTQSAGVVASQPRRDGR